MRGGSRIRKLCIVLHTDMWYCVEYIYGNPKRVPIFYIQRTEGEVIGQDKESQPGQSVSVMD